MNATPESSSTSGKKQVPVADALRTIQSGLVRIDAERAAAFGDLITFQSAKRNLLARHETLLALKLGADDARILDQKARGAAIDAALGDLQTAQAVAATPMPEVEPDGYVLHGFIRDADRQPVPDVVVALYDADGERRSDFTPATPATDANGYFKLTTAQLIDPAGSRDRTNPPSDSIPLELRAFASRQRQLQISVPTINAVPGHVDFCQLLAGDATPTPPTPPDKVTVRKSSSAGSKPSSNPAAGLQMMVKELRKTSPRTKKTAKTPETQTGSVEKSASKTRTSPPKPTTTRKKTRKRKSP